MFFSGWPVKSEIMDVKVFTFPLFLIWLFPEGLYEHCYIETINNDFNALH